MSNGKNLVVVSGPSGCGKDTVVEELMRRNPEISLSVSCTSRNKRDYEVEGKHYYFISKEEFRKRVDAGMMLEYAEYSGNYYGTPRSEIELKLEENKIVILVIEVNGAKQVKALLPDSLLVFIVPPSIEELEQRLKLRHTESEAERSERLVIAAREIQSAADYDLIIENDEVKSCAEKLEKAIFPER